MAKNLMIQGTMSNAGKSIVTAGILRVLKQDGYRVAPFKSQNMALNSYITKDGFEMGRAQVMQAEAAGTEPAVSMNPILLKPTSDVGSQVIVNGIPLKNMPASEYFKYKTRLIPDIMNAYEKLDKAYDVVVIEGAGSPAEINLKKNDIVNMGMAKLVDAPVLLVGDIDRGGVFAQLVGTIMLLEEEEKRRIKGLVINKFRGDKKILEPGLVQLTDICRIPVAGVIPYMYLDIDDEDSLSERLDNGESYDSTEEVLVDIAVIKLPHISNFTDFNALESSNGVHVRYVNDVSRFGNPDFVIIPGTKNTIGDMKWLRQSGLENCILKAASTDIPVMGVCGGFQMLGMYISDEDGTEAGGNIRGIGLLPVVTEFSSKKHQTRTQAVICASEHGMMWDAAGIWENLNGIKVSGYEIHMGESTILDSSEDDGFYGIVSTGRPFSVLSDGKEDGCVNGNVCGTYIHGIFDNEEFLLKLLKSICERKGITYEADNVISVKKRKEKEYDKLADMIRTNMDIEMVYKIIGL